ncbi:MAG TPA: hypothetical protein VGH22_15425 [Candidatus Binatia bacterium]
MSFSQFDRQNITEILRGHGNWFTAQLLRLIRKADPECRDRLALGFPEEVLAVARWEAASAGELELFGNEPDIDETNLGSCCACGKTGKEVRTIIMLNKRGASPGTGWGCFQCGLPLDGAVVVFCDDCFDAKAEPQFACVGYPKENVRIPIANLPSEPFDHDASKHPEMDFFVAAQPREH